MRGAARAARAAAWNPAATRTINSRHGVLHQAGESCRRNRPSHVRPHTCRIFSSATCARRAHLGEPAARRALEARKSAKKARKSILQADWCTAESRGSQRNHTNLRPYTRATRWHHEPGHKIKTARARARASAGTAQRSEAPERRGARVWARPAHPVLSAPGQTQRAPCL